MEEKVRESWGGGKRIGRTKATQRFHFSLRNKGAVLFWATVLKGASSEPLSK